MAKCDECSRRVSAVHETVSGRGLCDSCYRRLVAFAGAGAAMASGAGLRESVVTGVSTGAYAGAFTGEAAAARERRAKLARTRGFWRRLWVRIVG